MATLMSTPAAGLQKQDSSTLTTIQKLYATDFIRILTEDDLTQKITNKKYQEKLTSHGDSVLINKLAHVQIRDWYPGMKTVPEVITQTGVKLEIDTGKYWSFETDKLTQKEQYQDWAAAERQQAGLDMIEAIQTNFFLNLATNANKAPHASNIGATAGVVSGKYNLGTATAPVVLNPANIIGFLSRLSATLQEQKVPQNMIENLWVILPPEFKLLFSQSELTNAAFTGDTKNAMLRRGAIGEINGFTIYISNLLYKTTNANGDFIYYIPFGHTDAITFCTQMLEYEIFTQVESGFSALFKGLQVWGFQPVRPEMLGYAIATGQQTV